MRFVNRLAAVFAACFWGLCLYGCAGKSSPLDDAVASYEAMRYDEALEAFSKLTDSPDYSAKAYVYMGYIYSVKGDKVAAEDAYNKAILTGTDDGEAFRALGIYYYDSGAYDKAAENFTSAIAKCSTKSDIYNDCLIYLADSYFRAGKYTNAIEQLTKYITITDGKERANALFLRGRAYIMLGDENDAVLDFEESLKTNNDYDIYCQMYTAFCDAGYEDRGKSYLKRLLSDEGDDHLLYGKVYYYMEDYSQAEKYLLMAYNDGESEAVYFLALVYEAQGEYTKSQNLYTSYMSAHPNDRKIYNQYAVSLMQLEKYDNALVYIETGLEIKDEMAESDSANCKQALMYNQAVCYEYLGDYAKALELMTAYVEAYPDDTAALKEYNFLKTR